MGRKKGQVFSAEFKTRIVLELLEGDATINQIASKLNPLKYFLEKSISISRLI